MTCFRYDYFKKDAFGHVWPARALAMEIVPGHRGYDRVYGRIKIDIPKISKKLHVHYANSFEHRPLYKKRIPSENLILRKSKTINFQHSLGEGTDKIVSTNKVRWLYGMFRVTVGVVRCSANGSKVG